MGSHFAEDVYHLRLLENLEAYRIVNYRMAHNMLQKLTDMVGCLTGIGPRYISPSELCNEPNKYNNGAVYSVCTKILLYEIKLYTTQCAGDVATKSPQKTI